GDLLRERAPATELGAVFPRIAKRVEERAPVFPAPPRERLSPGPADLLAERHPVDAAVLAEPVVLRDQHGPLEVARDVLEREPLLPDHERIARGARLRETLLHERRPLGILRAQGPGIRDQDEPSEEAEAREHDHDQRPSPRRAHRQTPVATPAP